jgi:hypothetical protein
VFSESFFYTADHEQSKSHYDIFGPKSFEKSTQPVVENILLLGSRDKNTMQATS